MRAASALAIASTTSFSCVPRLPEAPGIHAAVTRIHRDDDVAAGFPRRMRRANGHRRRRRRRRHGHRPSCSRARGLAGNVENEAMTCIAGAARRGLDGDRPLHLEHQAQPVVRQLAGAHGGDRAVGRGQFRLERGSCDRSSTTRPGSSNRKALCLTGAERSSTTRVPVSVARCGRRGFQRRRGSRRLPQRMRAVSARLAIRFPKKPFSIMEFNA